MLPDDCPLLRRHIFVVYLALMVLGATYNLFLASRTPWLGTAFIFLTLGSFILILVTCVARAKTFQSSKFVFLASLKPLTF